MMEIITAYHGTAVLKNHFYREGSGAGVGAYFTPDFDIAKDYADLAANVDGDDPVVVEVLLAISNSYEMRNGSSNRITADERDKLEANGYDSVIGIMDDGEEYVVFDPSLITVVKNEVFN